MLKKCSLFLSLLGLSFIIAGCAGPEQKFGRGINNMTEFARLGEIRRSIEQTAIFGSPDQEYTTGFIHGFNRSLERTGVGVYATNGCSWFRARVSRDWRKRGRRAA